MKNFNLRSIGLATALGLGSIALIGCTTTTKDSQATPAVSRASMETSGNETLSRLYSTVPGTREMVSNAAGVLVFPAVVGGSFVVGAEHGRGALRVGGQTVAYYSITGGSIGLQAGGHDIDWRVIQVHGQSLRLLHSLPETARAERDQIRAHLADMVTRKFAQVG